MANVDVRFINPFIEEVLVVLKGTCNTTAEKKEVFVRNGDRMHGDISAVIAMNSSKFHGSMAISFDKACFLGIVEGMLDETYTDINEEIADACGEICNQVFSRARKTLNEQGHDIAQAIPSVIHGANHSIRHLVEGPCIVVKFQTSKGFFFVEAVVGDAEVKKAA